jgi:hypothetical protein
MFHDIKGAGDGTFFPEDWHYCQNTVRFKIPSQSSISFQIFRRNFNGNHTTTNTNINPTMLSLLWLIISFFAVIHKALQKLGFSKQKQRRCEVRKQATCYPWRGYRTQKSLVVAARCTQTEAQTKTVTSPWWCRHHNNNIHEWRTESIR